MNTLIPLIQWVIEIWRHNTTLSYLRANEKRRHSCWHCRNRWCNWPVRLFSAGPVWRYGTTAARPPHIPPSRLSWLQSCQNWPPICCQGQPYTQPQWTTVWKKSRRYQWQLPRTSSKKSQLFFFKCHVVQMSSLLIVCFILRVVRDPLI